MVATNFFDQKEYFFKIA